MWAYPYIRFQESIYTIFKIVINDVGISIYTISGIVIYDFRNRYIPYAETMVGCWAGQWVA